MNNKELEQENQKLRKFLGQSTTLIVDLIARITTLEKILVNKNVISEQEVTDGIKDIISKVTSKVEENLNGQDSDKN